MVRVKICGITSLEDAMTAVEAGADALGFIFVEKTPRFVTPERVAPIVQKLPPFVTPVGVFWDHPAGHVKAVAEACGLRALQFHGDERPEDLGGYTLPVIKTIKLAPPSGELGGRPPWTPTVTFLPYRTCAAALLLDSAARSSEGARIRTRYGGSSPRRRGPDDHAPRRAGSLRALRWTVRPRDAHGPAPRARARLPGGRA